MFVIKYRKIFIALSIFFIAFSLGCIAFFGVPLGIDFKGGSQLQMTYQETRPDQQRLGDALTNGGFGGATVQSVGDTGIIVKSRELSDADRVALIALLTEGGTVAASVDSFTTIGPSVGAELTRKALISIILVFIAIICFVAYAFRKVSEPLSSWKYGFAVIIALVHDIIIPTGAFALIAHYRGTELDTLFVVALLTTLALSVSDTIVVFDRIREHLKNGTLKEPFEYVVGRSLKETFARSVNTSLATLASIVALALIGPESTQLFAIVLGIGVFFGIYSSIFFATPLLVVMEKLQKKKS